MGLMTSVSQVSVASGLMLYMWGGGVKFSISQISVCLEYC